MRRHKVLFITIVPSPYQRDLFLALAQRPDVELNVCYMEQSAPDSPWPKVDLRPYERILPGFWFSLGDARGHVNWQLPDVLNQDFVILNSYTSMTGQWLMRSKLCGRRWLFWGERMNQNHGWKSAIQRRLAAPLASASAIVGIGRQAEADFHRRFPHLPHFSIPYHCDLSAFIYAPHLSQQSAAPITFLFCGQMIRRKGVDLLLTAFDRLIGEGANVRLLLVGREAELPKFLAAISPSTRARVDYAGFQAPHRLPDFFRVADIFVLPSRHDGWGVVINQALAAGLPVITSDAVGAGLELVDDCHNGLRVPANDVGELYRAMSALARDPQKIRTYGEASRRKADDLTPEAGAGKWLRIFETLAAESENTR